MEKTELPPPPTVDEDFRFYVWYSAVNVVIPIAALLVIQTLDGLLGSATQSSPTFVVYIGMPLSLGLILFVILANCWMLFRNPGRKALLLATLVVNMLAIALIGSPTFLVSLAELPAWISTYGN